VSVHSLQGLTICWQNTGPLTAELAAFVRSLAAPAKKLAMIPQKQIESTLLSASSTIQVVK
jgi:hypothetical protein